MFITDTSDQLYFFWTSSHYIYNLIQSLKTVQHAPLIFSLIFSLLKPLFLVMVFIKSGLFLSPLSRHRATSTTATAATSPMSASPIVTPTSYPWVGKTPASFSGELLEAGWATARRNWPLPCPPPPALQSLQPARKDQVLSSDRGREVITKSQRGVLVRQQPPLSSVVPLLPHCHTEHVEESSPEGMSILKLHLTPL